ncbi:MAG: zinc-binding dehydrogenase [Anaerolineae bacterium]|nr:zinc-binding dehydrogenase [Anaerolineae bacterium]
MYGAAAGKPGQVEMIQFPERDLQLGEVMVAPLACGICANDVKLVEKGTTDAKYALGHEVAGQIIQVAEQSRWKVGQRVVFLPYLPCGACYYCLRNQPTLCTNLFEAFPIPGGLADRVIIPRAMAERGLILIPEDMPAEAASLAEPVGCSIKGIEDSGVKPGDSVLIIGDGPMGIICAAAARAYGASPVLVAGMTPHRLQAAKEHFADAVIHVAEQDLLATTRSFTGERGADIVIAAVSNGEVLANAIQAVRPGGTVNSFAGVPSGTVIDLDVRDLHYKQIHLTGSFGISPVYAEKAIHLIHTARIPWEPIISARFPFEKTAEAVQYAAQRRGLKPVVIFNK